MQGPGREGPPKEEILKDSVQDIVTLRFGDKLGLLDFTGDQYFSWIRRERLARPGGAGRDSRRRGRLAGGFPHAGRHEAAAHRQRVRRQYPRLQLQRHPARLGVAVRNPFVPGRLTDDEIAIATSLVKMGEYAAGGPSFYSLAEASQDHYLSMLMERSIAEGRTIVSEPAGLAFLTCCIAKRKARLDARSRHDAKKAPDIWSGAFLALYPTRENPGFGVREA